jgi:hypothetical protein
MRTGFQLFWAKCLVGAALLAVLIAAAPGRASAQLIPVPDEDALGPTWTLSGGAGLLMVRDRYDVTDGTRWLMGEAIQMRAMLDIAMRSGSLGLLGTLATVPMSRANSGAPGEIQLRQLMLSFRSPGSDRFHQTLEVSGGWSQWANYRGDDVLTDEEKKPRNGLAVMLGYGAAFPIGSRVTFSFAQDIGAIVGSGKGLPVGESRSQSVYQTRMELRIRLSGG